MVKILHFLTIFSFVAVFIAAFVIIGMMHVLDIELPDKAVAAIFIPFGLVFIFGILGNAADGGEANVMGKNINRIDNPILYWGFVSLPLSLGIAVFLIGVNFIIK